ncbi:MAG: SDR family oxidoreductase [Geodermatophilaceae bacterium]|nr:SDR family oxidoreductase [Geodermatophilaceae bacterium]
MSRRPALVIGASRGIGAAIADRLADDGFHLILVGRTESDLVSVAERNVAKRSASAEVVVADIGTAEGTKAVVAAAVRSQPEVIVAVARTRAPWKRVSKLDPGEVGRSVDHHLDHLIAVAKTVLPAQRAAGYGRWVFVSSTVALMGGPGQAVYTAHKLAMEGFSRTLALEEGRNGITANVVAPGFIDTEATRTNYPDDMFAALSAMNTVGRAGTAEEVAHMVSALADRRAGFVTGSTVVVGGGVELAWPATLAVQSPALAAQFAAGAGTR